MKVISALLKVVAALAAIAGVVYVIATYGDKIVAWAKSLLNRTQCGCTCEGDCDACECEGDCTACECECECCEETEEVAEEAEPVAAESDFE